MPATDGFHEKKFDNLIKNNRQTTEREIAAQLGISQEHVGYIIDVLPYHKVCARWVPRVLTAEMRTSRFETRQQNYKNEDEEFLHNIMTANKTWVHHYEPETKHQPMEYHHKVLHVKKNSEHRLW